MQTSSKLVLSVLLGGSLVAGFAAESSREYGSASAGTMPPVALQAQDVTSAYPFVARVNVGLAGLGAGCSGALVEARWVLTAKQCFVVDGKPVVAGTPNPPTKVTLGDGTVVSVAQVMPHTQRDVVLVKLAAAVDDVAPVKLATTGPVADEVLVLAGFGRTGSEWVPAAAHAGDFTVAGVSDAQVQVVGKDAGQVGPCKGDAGGPGLRVSSDRVELVALTATGGQGGCFGGPPDGGKNGTQTRVDDLSRWIQEQVSAADIAVIANDNSKKCLAIGSGSTENAAHAIQWGCGGSADQDWRFRLRVDGTYEIRNDNSNLCLAIGSGSTENAAHALQWPCSETTRDQKWLLERNAGSTRLRNVNSNQCLAIGSGAVDDGAHALQWPCSSNRDQWWTIKVRNQGRDVRNEHSGLCISTVDWSVKGAHAVQAACGNANDAEWQLHATGGGFAQLRNDRSGQCLAIGSGSAADGAHALQWPCSDTTKDQQWYVEVKTNGLTQLVNRNSNKCLTIDGGGKNAGAHLVQQPCNAAKVDQHWRI